MKIVHIKLWFLLTQSPFQELFPVPIRNIMALIFDQFLKIKKTGSSTQKHFESVSANLDLLSLAVRLEKLKIF